MNPNESDEAEGFIELNESIIIFDKEKYDPTLTKYYGITNQEKNRIPADKREMRNVLTKYEKYRIICDRAEQLRRGAEPKIEIKNMKWTQTLEKYEYIATTELQKRKLNFIIRRYSPNGKYEDWHLNELAY